MIYNLDNIFCMKLYKQNILQKQKKIVNNIRLHMYHRLLYYHLYLYVNNWISNARCSLAYYNRHYHLVNIRLNTCYKYDMYH